MPPPHLHFEGLKLITKCPCTFSVIKKFEFLQKPRGLMGVSVMGMAYFGVEFLDSSLGLFQLLRHVSYNVCFLITERERERERERE